MLLTLPLGIQRYMGNSTPVTC